MRRPLFLLLLFLASAFCLLSTARAQTNQVTPTWTFETFGLQPYGSKRIVITPLSAIGNHGNHLAVGDPIRGTTTNSSFTTNLLNGSYYRVEFFSGFNVYTLTNFFDVNTTDAVDGGDPLYRAFGQQQDRSAYAFSGPYSMSIFMLKYGGVATNAAFYGSLKLPVGTGNVGDVWTLTNATTGAGEFRTPTGGGGGGTGNVSGPGSSAIGNVAVFSATDGAHIGDGGTLGTAAFQPSSAFDAAGSAGAVQSLLTTYTNSVNITSGNSAGVNTNRFATPLQQAILSNNLNAANLTVGTVPTSRLGTGADGSGIHFFADDNTFKSIPGGGDMLKANNLSDVTSTTTALANLNGVPNTRALTFNGTANQINSSAGSQNFTSDRTWTFSLSSTLLLPGTLNVTGDQTNQGNLSVTGNTTNFGNVKVAGNQTNAGTLSVTGNQTNFSGLEVDGNQTNAGTFSTTGNATNFAGTYLKAVTASTLLSVDANNKVTSIPNGVGVLTNDAGGHPGYALLRDSSTLVASQYVSTDVNTNLVSTRNGNNWTNLVAWTHEGTTTNITITFTGSAPQLFTCTNGPSIGQDYFIHFAGANGSASIRFVGSSYNNLHFDYQPTWLSGSNSVITNGTLSFTSYGGTNAAQLVAAMKEKQ